MRFKAGHAWSLKGQCRFCRMTRQIFLAEGEPDYSSARSTLESVAAASGSTEVQALLQSLNSRF